MCVDKLHLQIVFENYVYLRVALTNYINEMATAKPTRMTGHRCDDEWRIVESASCWSVCLVWDWEMGGRWYAMEFTTIEIDVWCWRKIENGVWRLTRTITE